MFDHDAVAPSVRANLPACPACVGRPVNAVGTHRVVDVLQTGTLPSDGADVDHNCPWTLATVTVAEQGPEQDEEKLRPQIHRSAFRSMSL